MNHIFTTFLLLYVSITVYGLGNITSFLRSFDRNLSQQKDVCSEPVNNCTRLNTILTNSTCFDVHLNYEYTYENTNFNLNLDKWAVMQAIPQCWNYLNKLLCSLKYPECSQMNSNWIVKKTAMAICLVTKKECPLLISHRKDDNSSQIGLHQDNDVYSLVDETPAFLDCDQYSSKCLIDTYKRMTPMRDQVNCKWPTVKTSQHSLWIKGISKCSFYCQTPFFTKEEYQQSNSLFGVLGILFFFLNIFVLATLILHQIQHSKYHWHPLLLNLFIIHLYLLLSTFGWMMSLLPGIGNSVVCRHDGAMQIRKPQVKVGEALWCVIVFSVVYFPLIAASITSISFYYSVFSMVKNYANCCLNKDGNTISSSKSSKLPFLSKKMGFSMRKSDEKISKKNRNIELKELKPKDDIGVRSQGKGLSWEFSVSRNQSLSGQVYVLLISVTLLVISLTIAEIRADPVSGICFLSPESMTTRICLSLLPLTIFLVIKTVIIYLVIRHLGTIQRHLTVYASCQQEIHSRRISRTTKFYVFIVLFLWTFWMFSVYSHWYIFVNESSWFRALTNNFLCKLKQTMLSSTNALFTSDSDSHTSCPLDTKPIMNVFILHNLSYFAIHIVYIISSIFNRHSFLVWKYQLMRCFFRIEADASTRELGESKNLYLGLQSRSLLDALWNPGVFVYLVTKKTTNLKHDTCKSGIEDKSATIASGDASSASYCVYHQDGSLRSCVSMPPINGMFRHHATSFSQELSKDSHVGTTLDDFLKVTQCFIDQNSVRRSNSFAGRPCQNSSSCISNLHTPHSNYHHGNQDACKSILNDRTSPSDPTQRHAYDTCQGHYCSRDPIASKMDCCSLNRLSYLRNTPSIVDRTYGKKSNRRFSMYADRRKDISSRSTLHRRKRVTRYSISPRSLSKVINQRSSISSRLADPASCHSSSFSAESYNSYNLMAQQMGGRWRDICRTRMTLHDAMLWAKSASLSFHHKPICSHADVCQHHQCCVTPSLSGHNYQCMAAAGNNEYPTQIDKNGPLTKDPSSGYCEPPKDSSYFMNSQNLILPPNSDSSKDDNKSQMKLDNDDSSDQFNSEDDVISNGYSVRSSGKESGEFCSDDEVVSLINSDE